MKGKASVGIAGVMALMPFAQAIQYCPPNGQVLPTPYISDAIANKTNLWKTLTQLVENPGDLFNKSTVSFSVTVTSSSKTLFEFHHTADLLSAKGAQHVDGDTIYRIASVSKLFTTLSAMLQDGLNLDDLAWKHIPELEGVDAYKDITLRMLASHVSGIVRDGKFCFCEIITFEPLTRAISTLTRHIRIRLRPGGKCASWDFAVLGLPKCNYTRLVSSL